MLNVSKTMLTIGEDGLLLAGRAVLSKFSSDGQLDIDQDEERILALLGMAYHAPLPDWIMPRLKNAAAKWNSGNQGLVTMLLIQTGLQDLSGDPDALGRLDTMEKAFNAGEILRGFIHECKRTAFNPNEPRDAHGRWTTGGAEAINADQHPSSGNNDNAVTDLPGAIPAVYYPHDGDPLQMDLVDVDSPGRNTSNDPVPYVAGDGTQFVAPKYANFYDQYQYGQSLADDNMLTDKALLARTIGQNGTFDYQRRFGAPVKDYDYRPAANYGVGVQMNGAGFSLTETIFYARAYALLNSRNRFDQAINEEWWTRGWNDAQSGRWNRKP